MKKLHWFWLMALLPALFVFASCGNGNDEQTDAEAAQVEEVQIDEFQLLSTYLDEQNFINLSKKEGGAPTMIKADKVKELLDKSENLLLLDFRKAKDYAGGHIDGAKNLKVTDLLDFVNQNDLASFTKVVTICYSGQTASFAAAALRLLGHKNVFAMKWGMSAWNMKFAKDKWLAKATNQYAEQLETEENAKAAVAAFPTIATGKTIGKEILEARVAEVLAAGFKATLVKADELFANGAEYYISNYWPAEKYAMGHIPGAVQYQPKKTLAASQALNTFPTDKAIVTYCYTGQHSAFVTMYLRVLGYDARSLAYGANSFMHGVMTEKKMGHAFNKKQIHDYPTVTSEMPADAAGDEEEGGC